MGEATTDDGAAGLEQLLDQREQSYLPGHRPCVARRSGGRAQQLSA